MSVADFLPYLAAGIARTMLEQLRTALPLPIPDTPENRDIRDQAAFAAVKALNPTNAADAMRTVSGRDRVLIVKCDAEADNITVSVQDSGSGIDQKNIERIFDPFFSTKNNGMGIGLAICRTIVKAHGGRMSASSVAPYGSVFRIVLPAVHPA